MTDARLDRLKMHATKGELVLFLGAGALVGSTIGKDNRPPLLGVALRDRLQELFFKEEGPTNVSLKRVCTNIQNTKGKEKLREALVELLTPVNPSKALLDIPRLRWRAIYTVNVDDSIERAYENSTERTQDLKVVVLSDHKEARNPDKEVSNTIQIVAILRRLLPNSTLNYVNYQMPRACFFAA
ncbi:MAG: hypothetical protein WBQ69_07655 [Gallionella sp.]